jgi:hypothetical protein
MAASSWGAEVGRRSLSGATAVRSADTWGNRSRKSSRVKRELHRISLARSAETGHAAQVGRIAQVQFRQAQRDDVVH